MNKEDKKAIKRYNKRIKELEKLKENEELLKFITKDEVNFIIEDYKHFAFFTEFGEC